MAELSDTYVQKAHGFAINVQSQEYLLPWLVLCAFVEVPGNVVLLEE